jgi:hypothetical protein
MILTNWKFTNNLNDSSGNGYNLTKSGSTNSDVYSEFGRCQQSSYVFNGDNRFLTLPTQILYSSGTLLSPYIGEFLLRFLVKFNSTTPNQNILYYHYSNIQCGWGIGLNGSSQLSLYKYTGAAYFDRGYYVYPKFVPNTDVWYYMVVRQINDQYIHLNVSENFNGFAQHYAYFGFNKSINNWGSYPKDVGLNIGNPEPAPALDFGQYVHTGYLDGDIDDVMFVTGLTTGEQDAWIDPNWYQMLNCFSTQVGGSVIFEYLAGESGYVDRKNDVDPNLVFFYDGSAGSNGTSGTKLCWF